MKKKEIIHLSIEGEMTISQAAELKKMIVPALTSNQDIEIDLSRVTELDSAGLQVMVSSKLEAIVRGTQLSFVGHSPAVREVLDLCDVGGFFGDPMVIG
jgi:anti-anti-sigma factor